jgi:SAM-dependent methyltransferase
MIEYYALPGNSDWLSDIRDVIERIGAHRIADLGAGANPVLDPELVEQAGLDYTIFDISEDELAKAGPRYRKVVADVTSAGFAEDGKFDLVLSRWLLEHIADPEQFHRNVFAMLSPGGRAVHFFPTLYSLPFVVNRLLPEFLSQRLLDTSFEGRTKFPARYRWCRGPTRGQIRRLESTGFEIERYVGFYGHPYFRRIRALDAIERRCAAALARHPIPLLTSFASVTLAKAA